MAMTAECLSCSTGQTVDEYCAENPSTEGCPRACCMAMTAECLSCSAGLTVEEYCAENPDTEGCNSAGLVQAVAKTQEACQVGDHVECPDENGTMCAGNQCCPRSTYGKTYPCPSAEQGWSKCESSAKVTNCLEQTPHACCRAMTAECLSCSAGQTEEEYCAENPSTEGCPRACCMAMTA